MRAGGRARLQVRPPRSGYSVAPGAVLPGRGEPGRGRAAPGFGHSRAGDAPDKSPRAAGQVPVAAAYGPPACSPSAVIWGTLTSGACTGGMAIASAGGMASGGPTADGRPSMA